MLKAILPMLFFMFLVAMCVRELPKAIDKNLDIYSNYTYGIDREAVIRGQQ